MKKKKTKKTKKEALHTHKCFFSLYLVFISLPAKRKVNFIEKKKKELLPTGKFAAAKSRTQTFLVYPCSKKKRDIMGDGIKIIIIKSKIGEKKKKNKNKVVDSIFHRCCCWI